MSKYYVELEDVIQRLDNAIYCANMGEFDSYLEAMKRLRIAYAETMPTIEVSEDCISREHMKSLGYINKGDFNSVETIREWIDNAPSVVPKAEEGEWIPCSERLPKKSGDYLTTTSFDLGETEPAREVYKNYFCAISQNWLTDDEDVIAWMPLPEPYVSKDERIE